MPSTMEANLYVFFLLVAIFVVDGGTSTCTSKSTAGTHFMIGVPESKRSPDKVVLHITSVNSTTVSVRAPYIYFKETFKIIDYIQVNLSRSIMHKSSSRYSTYKKGIEIKSDKPCSVTVLTHDSNDATEGFLAYPVSALSTNYTISSYDPYSSSSEILLVGVENHTNVVLHKTHYGVSSISFNEFDTYMFKSTYDLSDSVISSDKPIAVFSATGSSRIPINHGDYQYIVEQMVPIKFWAKEYIVPALFPRENYMYRIYNSENYTDVQQYFVNNTDKVTVVFPGHKTTIASEPAVVTADKPISVIQYGYDTDRMDGDPFMTTVQAISQFQNSYEFVTDFDYMGNLRWDVTLVITVPTTEIGNILLDGSNTAIKRDGHRLPVPSPFSNYSVVYLNMTSRSYGSFHTLRNNLGRPFGATVYSFPGTTAAYGYPLKFALKDKACQVPTMTTATAVTATTPVSSISNTGGIQCFNCRDIPHLKYCDRVASCMEHEVCYVESYTKPHGVKLYRSGCIEKARCVPLNGQNDCLQCCDSSDFCNMDGCEEEAQGSLSAGTRGPYCYDCSHLGENEKCQSVQLCPSDEVCMVEKYVWGDNDFNYVMGCIRPHVCEAKKRSLEDQKLNVRHAPACTHCCTSDFCNKNCTHHSFPGIVG